MGRRLRGAGRVHYLVPGRPCDMVNCAIIQLAHKSPRSPPIHGVMRAVPSGLVGSRGVIRAIMNGASLIPGHLREYLGLTTLSGALTWRTFSSLATRGTSMSKKNKINIPRDVTASDLADQMEHAPEDPRDRFCRSQRSQPPRPAQYSKKRVSTGKYPRDSTELPPNPRDRPSTSRDKTESLPNPRDRPSTSRDRTELPPNPRNRPSTGQGSPPPGSMQGERWIGRRRSRLPMPLPPLGQPGAKDDPMREGLSGAAVRWYLRFLEQGLKPDEARERAVNRNNPLTHPQERVRKRGREMVSPQEVGKRRKVLEAGPSTSQSPGVTPGSYANVAKAHRVAVLPKEYPVKALTPEELTQLEECLVEEISLSYGKEEELSFSGIHFKAGLLVVECESRATADWLCRVVPNLSTWKGIELATREGADIPKPHTVSLFLPRSAGQSVERALHLLGVQNKGLRITDWKVISLRDEGPGQLMTANIDPLSYKMIVERDFTVGFRFGRIPVRGLREPAKATEKEEQSEGKEAQEKEVGDSRPGIEEGLGELNLTVEGEGSQPEPVAPMTLEGGGPEDPHP